MSAPTPLKLADVESFRASALRHVETAMQRSQVALAVLEGGGEPAGAEKHIRATARLLRRAWDDLDVLRGEIASLGRLDDGAAPATEVPQ